MTLEKIFTLKGLLKIFHDIENAKDKVLETHPNLEECDKTHQSIENMVTPYCMLYKKANIVQTTLVIFNKEIKH